MPSRDGCVTLRSCLYARGVMQGGNDQLNLPLSSLGFAVSATALPKLNLVLPCSAAGGTWIARAPSACITDGF